MIKIGNLYNYVIIYGFPMMINAILTQKTEIWLSKILIKNFRHRKKINTYLSGRSLHLILL